MSQRHNRNQKSSLALAIAGGSTVKAWAESHQVPARTAYTWAREEGVCALVEEIRRRAVDRAIGRLARHATAAAGEIGRLATKAESEATRLNAARAVLADLLTVSDYASLERRLTELEKRHAREDRHDPKDPPA
jgi:hypothetical protein